MEAAERKQILEQLAHGRQVLHEALHGLGEEQAAVHPAAGRWSVLDCVEHLALVERALLKELEGARTPETPVGSEDRARRIAARAADRSRPAPAPEMVRPQHRFATLAEALDSFEKARAATIRFVENCAVDPRTLAGAHPLIGPINCYETLLAMAAHPIRHSDQIREIRAAL